MDTFTSQQAQRLEPVPAYQWPETLQSAEQEPAAEPQGLTSAAKPATLRSIETTKQGTSSEPAEPHKMRDNQSSRRKDAQGLQGYRVAEQSRKRCERKETDTAQGRTQPSEPAAASSKPHETQQSRTGCECRQRAARAAPARKASRSRAGCHGGSGQRVGSEGVSHERTKFRCT